MDHHDHTGKADEDREPPTPADFLTEQRDAVIADVMSRVRPLL